MTPRQKKQRKAFDARRIVPPESIATEIKAIIDLVHNNPVEGPIVAKRLRDVFPFAFREQNSS